MSGGFGTIGNLQLLHRHLRTMPDDGLHRIDRKTAVAQNIGCKIGDFHRVSVTLFQNAEAVPGTGKHKPAKLLPVAQPIAKVNILGYISHNGIGTVLDTGAEHMVSKHAEVLCLVDNDVMRLADDLRLLHQLVDQSQRRQIVDIEGV